MPDRRLSIRLTMTLLGALVLAALLVPAARPAVAAEQLLARLDATERNEVDGAAFRLTVPAEVRLEVVGAWFKEQPVVDCWLLDGDTRETIWALDGTTCRSTDEYGFNADATLGLDPGRYEVYYSTVKPKKSITIHGAGSEALGGLVRGIFGHRILVEDREFHEKSCRDRWGVLVTAAGLDGAQAFPESLEAEDRNPPGELAGIRRVGGKDFETRAFVLPEDAEVEIYALGEGHRGKMFDHGWLVRSDDRSRPWTMTFDRTTHAGGAGKNRMVRERMDLEAGRYEVWYVSDDSHHCGSWNQPPPRDPGFWGITVRLVPTDGTPLPRVRRGEPTAFPANRVIASIWRPGNNAVSTRVVRLRRGGPVLCYGIGETDGSNYYDWGWVRDCRTGKLVWIMDGRTSAWAGGAAKNQMNEGAVDLPAGEYAVSYVTDDSHSAGGGWNAAPPWDTQRAGLTLCWLGDRPDPGAYVSYGPERSRGMLGLIAAAGDHANKSARFSLGRRATVRVICQGEGASSEMYDYGWIERNSDGQRVWTMTYDISTHAGGARKNREWRGDIELPAGDYTMRYVSDDSHSFNHWNATPPDNRGADWGLAVYLPR